MIYYKNNNLLFGRDIDIIKNIETERVNLIVNDPPYNINIATWDKDFTVKEISKEWYRVLSSDGNCFIFTGWSYYPLLVREMYRKFKLKDVITWDRIKGRGGRRSLVSTAEMLLWYVKSDNYYFNRELSYSTSKKKTKGMGCKNGKDVRALSNCWTDISPLVPWSKEKVKGFTCQKPVKLIERIINIWSKEGDLVLDCYSGTGTTAEACMNMYRKFVLIEKNPINYELSKIRILKYLIYKIIKEN